MCDCISFENTVLEKRENDKNQNSAGLENPDFKICLYGSPLGIKVVF